MAKTTNITIKIEFERFVKLTCMDLGCVSNLHRSTGYFCNRKQIEIGNGGHCISRRIANVESSKDQLKKDG